MLTTLQEASKKYGMSYKYFWKLMKLYGVEPVKEVRHGKRRWLFYDSDEIDRVMREKGYLDAENNELLRRFYAKWAQEEPTRE